MLQSQYYDKVLGMKVASGVLTPRELKLRRSIEPSQPAPGDCDGDGELCSQEEESPDLEVEGATREGCSGRRRSNSPPAYFYCEGGEALRGCCSK